jgi:hypothetical protein
MWYCERFIILRPTVSRPVCPGIGPPSGPMWQLRVCYFVAPSLTRGWVCSLLLMLVLTRAAPLGWVLQDSKPYFIVPILETSPTWRARSPYLYPPRNRVGSLSVASHDSQGYGGGILSRLHTGKVCNYLLDYTDIHSCKPIDLILNF